MQIIKVPTLTGQWRKVYEKERPSLQPNAITGVELADYVQKALDVAPYPEESFLAAIRSDVLKSAFFAEKLHGAAPDPVAFRCGDGSFIGVDRVSGWFLAENDAIRDELTYVKGLDEADLADVMRTVDWLRCKKAFEARRKKKIPPKPKMPSLFCRRVVETRNEKQ